MKIIRLDHQVEALWQIARLKRPPADRVAQPAIFFTDERRQKAKLLSLIP
jgi:hypothetical protein